MTKIEISDYLLESVLLYRDGDKNRGLIEIKRCGTRYNIYVSGRKVKGRRKYYFSFLTETLDNLDSQIEEQTKMCFLEKL